MSKKNKMLRISEIPKQKKDKDVEYGVMYPDGTVEWHDKEFTEVSTPEDRDIFNKNYLRRAVELRFPYYGDLIFLKRSTTKSYGVAELIED